MKKLFGGIVVVVIVVLSGCGQYERGVAQMTGYSKICIEGVSYLQFSSGATVQYTRDGKIKGC